MSTDPGRSAVPGSAFQYAPKSESHPVFDGMSFLLGLGSPVLIVLLGTAILRQRVLVYMAGMLATAVLAVAGGCAGAVVWATEGVRRRSRTGAIIGWTLAAYAAAAILGAGMIAFVRTYPLSYFAGEASRIALSVGALRMTAISGLLFGIAMAEALAAHGGLPLVGSELAVGRLTLRGSVGWAVVAFAIWVGADRLALPSPSAVQSPTASAETSDSLPDVQRRASENPDDAHVQFQLGQALFTQKRFADAERAYRAADRAEPNNAYTLNALGWTLLRERKPGQAIPYLLRATQRDSDLADAWYALGWSYAALDSLPSARPAYAHAVRLNPGNAQIEFEYAAVLERLGETPLALGQVERALQHDSTNAGLQNLAGYLYRSEGNFSEARAHQRAATRLAPRNAGAWAELGATEFLMDDSVAAARDFATSERIDSTYIRLRPEYQIMRRAAEHARKH